jgi:hypothetical protein
MQEETSQRAADERERAERAKDLARGRALGTPWVPEAERAKRGPCEQAPTEDGVVAEDEEGMIGHPTHPPIGPDAFERGPR